jgi:GntR family transcriptional repressor for pyruvate dehydrogenase complex
LKRPTFSFSEDHVIPDTHEPVADRTGSSPFQPAPVMRAVDQVRVSIVQAIATGRLRPGDRLPSEVEQARGFQVSRAAVREALRSLVEMGLITTVQGRGGGSFVNRMEAEPVERNLGEAMDVMLHLDAINLAELLEARRALERACVVLGAERRAEPHLGAMAEVLDAARDERLSDQGWLELDVRFHRAMARSAENRVLTVPLTALHAIVQPRLNHAILPLLRRSEINAEHTAIYEAIRDRDAEAAGNAVDRHVDHLERAYREVGVL